MRFTSIGYVCAVGSLMCVLACSGNSELSGPLTDAGPSQSPTSADDLSQATTTTIPSGDAHGSMYAGSYDVTLTTTACSAACGPVGPVEIMKDLPHSYRDVGDTKNERWAFTQAPPLPT